MKVQPLQSGRVPTRIRCACATRAAGTGRGANACLGMSQLKPWSPQSLSDTPAQPPRVPARAVHLCLDMQNLLGPQGPWAAKWAERVLPAVVSLAEHAPSRTVFTRFVPPAEPDDARGAWR